MPSRSARPGSRWEGLTPETNKPLSAELTSLIGGFTVLLRNAAGPDEVFATATQAAVPDLGDLAVLVSDRDEGGERIAVAARRAVQAERTRRELASVLPLLRQIVTEEGRAGRTFLWLPTVSPTALRHLAGHERAIGPPLARIGVHSLIAVALRAEGRNLGVLTVARTESPEPYHAMDLAVAQVMARRVAVALDQAQLRHGLPTPSDRRARVEAAMDKWIRVFDLAWWGAAVVDVAERRIDVVNPAFARLHGYSRPDELSGLLFSDLLPRDVSGAPAAWPGAAGNGSPGSYETEHLRADGSTFPVLVNITPLQGSGQPSAYVVTVQDLTDLRRTEERLRRAQRMEAVGRLAGGVAHEVNNMMTIILGFGDLLARSTDLPAERKREVEEILKAATRAGKITTQLLAFSRQQVLSPVEMRLGEVVEEIVPMLRLTLPANVRIETARPRAASVVRADRTQLEQVLINLSFNARDAMPEGGTIRILTESRWLDGETGERLMGVAVPEGRYGLISVTDTGQGMDRETVLRVFEPFFTTKGVGQGTGLGLSTVYGIVKQSGGYVWVESTPTQGTTFTVCLPEVGEAPAPAAPRTDTKQPEGGRTGTVMVIEDEDRVRELAARILSDRGHRVVSARNGGEAVSLVEARAGGIDLVITDVIVPDIGTDALAREMRRLCPPVRLLYMSGYPHGEIVSRGLLPVTHPFVQKPFTGQELADAVDRILASPAPGGGAVNPALLSG